MKWKWRLMPITTGTATRWNDKKNYLITCSDEKRFLCFGARLLASVCLVNGPPIFDQIKDMIPHFLDTVTRFRLILNQHHNLMTLLFIMRWWLMLCGSLRLLIGACWFGRIWINMCTSSLKLWRSYWTKRMICGLLGGVQDWFCVLVEY